MLDAVIYTSFLVHVTLHMHGASNIIFSYMSTVRSLLPPTTKFIARYDHMANVIFLPFIIFSISSSSSHTGTTDGKSGETAVIV
jgi:hypothetical protein